MEDIKGLVFDIKRYATGDGPGIRTIVFLKGCPLRCEWCANPESQLEKGQIIYYRNKCSGCLKCIRACRQAAIRTDPKYGLVTNLAECSLCGRCVEECFNNARELAGKWMGAEQVYAEVNRDRHFYENTGGGVTLSGGEPFMQTEFSLSILNVCRQNGIHTAIETCGQTKENNVKELLPYLDYIMYDYKHVDSGIHRKYTGFGNEQIVENLVFLNNAVNFQKLIVRIPYIPGFNSDYETVYRMFAFLSGLKRINWVEIMPYHRLGKMKYEGIARPYSMESAEPVKKEELAQYVDLGNRLGLKVKIDAQS